MTKASAWSKFCKLSVRCRGGSKKSWRNWPRFLGSEGDCGSYSKIFQGFGFGVAPRKWAFWWIPIFVIIAWWDRIASFRKRWSQNIVVKYGLVVVDHHPKIRSHVALVSQSSCSIFIRSLPLCSNSTLFLHLSLINQSSIEFIVWFHPFSETPLSEIPSIPVWIFEPSFYCLVLCFSRVRRTGKFWLTVNASATFEGPTLNFDAICRMTISKTKSNTKIERFRREFDFEATFLLSTSLACSRKL